MLSIILSRKQRLEDNLSSRQLFIALDSLIARALYPMASTSFTFQEAVAEIIASLTFSRRAKLSDAQLSLLFKSFFSPPKEAVDLVVSVEADRLFLFNYLSRIESLNKEYRPALIAHARSSTRCGTEVLVTINKVTGRLGNSRKLYPAMQDSVFWFKAALEFKACIIEKYHKLIAQSSKKLADSSAIEVDSEDIFSSNLITANRAVDRFASTKGVFTSFLNRWLLSAVKSRNANGIGLVFGSSTSYVKEGSLFSVSLDNVVDVADPNATVVNEDSSDRLLTNLDAVADDFDIKSALLLSKITPVGIPSLKNK